MFLCRFATDSDCTTRFLRRMAFVFVTAIGFDSCASQTLMDHRWVSRFHRKRRSTSKVSTAEASKTNQFLLPPSLAPQVNIVCTKVKGEPLYEVVKPIAAHQELIVYYLPERPEELFFVRMRSTLYRRTMDSILEGESHSQFIRGSFFFFLTRKQP